MCVGLIRREGDSFKLMYTLQHGQMLTRWEKALQQREQSLREEGAEFVAGVEGVRQEGSRGAWRY